MRIRIHDDAELEADDAAVYYEQSQLGLGIQFTDELISAVNAIAESPRLFPMHPRSTVAEEIRLYPLSRFPYVVMYVVESDELFIVAIAHTSRHPNYWYDRLRS